MGNNKEQQGTGTNSGPCRGSSSLAENSQTALERYKARRAGIPLDEVKKSRPKHKAGKTGSTHQWLLLLLLLPTLGFFGWRAYSVVPGDPLQLTYEVDLTNAPTGLLTVTLIAEGKLPPQLSLEFPQGVFGKSGGGLNLVRPSAHSLKDNGEMGRSLTVDQTPAGWRLGTRGLHRVGFIYRVDLAKTHTLETDIRKYISTPVSGGVRFAGFEVFLEPTNASVDDITVTVHNPHELQVLVPWPALVKNQNRADTRGPLADAHLGYGQGYNPGAGSRSRMPGQASGGSAGDHGATAPVPTNLLYHPHNLADLNNALLVCGDIRTLSSQARDCVIQFATDRDWLFSNQDALELVRHIARTEMGFFGSAPTQQITVLLSTNEVRATEGFDVYGVHTGSSILVMLHPETTYGLLEEQAASVIAHEMFHGWLGEAITQLEPETMWFTEGATTWYSARMLNAAGIWSPHHARQVLTDRLNRDFVMSPQRGKTSIASAAADVMGDAELVRFSYAGGVAACMALDQWLAGQSGLERPLDEVLRYLYEHSDDVAFSRQSLEDAVFAVTGVDCSVWLESYVYGVQSLPPVERLI